MMEDPDLQKKRLDGLRITVDRLQEATDTLSAQMRNLETKMQDLHADVDLILSELMDAGIIPVP